MAGLKDKLQKQEIVEFILESDIIWLSETKKCFNVNVPGFNVYYNPSKYGTHRGGIMLLIRNKLCDYVKSIDMDTEGQIWVVLNFLVNYTVGGVYIPPDDSPYFQQECIGALDAHTRDSENVIVMGDLNARVAVPTLSDPDGGPYVYTGVVDPTLNARGRAIMNVCENNSMVICNHLAYKGRQLGGQLSFKRRQHWISELDLCLSKHDCLEQISELNIRQDIIGSDHAPLCATLAIPSATVTSIGSLMRRSAMLGQHTEQIKPMPMHKMKKSQSYKCTDLQNLTAVLQDVVPPVIPPVVTSADQLSGILEAGCNVIMDSATRCRDSGVLQPQWDQSRPRWAQILDTQDSKTIWKSLNWKGTFENLEGTQPSDNAFKNHFERLLAQENGPTGDEYIDIDSAPYVPVLDDPFGYSEFEKALNSVNSNKSYSGICPGILKALPLEWLMFFMLIFNSVFSQCVYPILWCYNKLFVLFKSGDRLSCDNYRGISIMDTLAKIYDTLILNRLMLWCHIDKCQAGAQKGRSCLEQILTLRLLIDFVKNKRLKLYVLFIDYSKAYDRVPRHKLIEVLKSRGCGRVMLRAIQAMFTCTKNVLKSAVIDATVGVRQGAPSSCLLFIIYMDVMVRMLKNAFISDGFLGALHALLLMDDTVILATNRQMCEAKLKVVIQYCKEFGMIINAKKTKYFIVNGSDKDKSNLEVEGISVGYSPQYLYLGAWFTESGNMSDVITLHVKANQATINKFSIFCAANTQMPFKYKRLVFDAAVTSSLLYGCESWLTESVRSISTQYNQLVRCLLGVRKNTCIDLCLIEAGIPPLQHVILKRRCKYLKYKIEVNDLEQPFTYVYRLCSDNNTPAFQCLSKCLSYDINCNPFTALADSIRDRPLLATKFQTYKNELNLSLNVHPIYKSSIFIPDYQRQSFSRVRLISHNLKIETGRWSRIPRERRVCPCDGTQLQTETHALTSCPLTQNIRVSYPMLDFSDLNRLFSEDSHIRQLCSYVHEALCVYS